MAAAVSRGPASNQRPKWTNFPVFSLLIREFDAESSSYQTASSATESFRLRFGHERRKSARVRPVSQRLVAAENAPNPRFCQFAVSFLCDDLIRGHDESKV